ncbi:MAG: DUF2437 domain-containing protein, partial [Propionibacteriaceae bacterium]|nr:DUF2437 domain-containing protein [Propionibacteriaceae bacterium]
MRIVRFSNAGNIAFGVVELSEDSGQHPQTIAVLNGDPLAGDVKYTGERVLLSEARLLAPVIPRSKIIGAGRNYVASGSKADKAAVDDPFFFFKPNTSV